MSETIVPARYLLLLLSASALLCSPGWAAKPADISFDDLKIEIEPASRFDEKMLTDKIKAIDGEIVKLRGFMWPSFQQTGIKHFVLLMNTKCKFGSAKDPVWCNVRVKMGEGETASFSTRPMAIEGRLKVDLMKGPKYDISLFSIDNARVVK